MLDSANWAATKAGTVRSHVWGIQRKTFIRNRRAAADDEPENRGSKSESSQGRNLHYNRKRCFSGGRVHNAVPLVSNIVIIAHRPRV